MAHRVASRAAPTARRAPWNPEAGCLLSMTNEPGRHDIFNKTFHPLPVPLSRPVVLSNHYPAPIVSTRPNNATHPSPPPPLPPSPPPPNNIKALAELEPADQGSDCCRLQGKPALWMWLDVKESPGPTFDAFPPVSIICRSFSASATLI